MHHIFHTEAFVVEARQMKEADRMLVLYTRDLGLVHAHARGIRNTRSRLRYGLQEYSRAKVDLVRGKDIWRLTSATPITAHTQLRKNKSSFVVMHQALKLVSRLAGGEEAHPDIFDDLVAGFALLEHATADTREAIELVLILRILSQLGYVSDTSNLARYLSGTFNPQALAGEQLPRQTMLAEINRALRESHL